MVVLLAQLIAPDPAPLPEPPWWQHYLLEFPWPLAGFLLAVAFIGAWLLFQRGKTLFAAALALTGVCLSSGLTILSLLIETPREQITWSSRKVVEFTARAESGTLESFLTEKASLRVLGSGTRLDRAQILARVKADMGGRYALRGRAAGISRVQASIDGPGVGRTQFRLQATHDASGIPVGMWWRFQWRMERDAWRVHALELIAFDGLSPDADPGF